MSFAAAIGSDRLAVSVELELGRSSRADAVARQCAALAPWVDAVQIADNPYGRVRMAPLAAAAIALREGVEPVPHLGCRDRNVLALESELLGAATLGVKSLVLLRGDDYRAPGAGAPVFDTGARRLLGLAAATDDFHIGTVATVFDPVKDWQPAKLEAKVAAGARFIQTQPCFDPAVLRRWLAHLVAARLTWRASVVVGLAVLPDADTATWLAANLRGAVVPDALIERLKSAADPAAEGVRACAELMRELASVPGVSGINLAAWGGTQAAVDAIRTSGIRFNST